MYFDDPKPDQHPPKHREHQPASKAQRVARATDASRVRGQRRAISAKSRRRRRWSVGAGQWRRGGRAGGRCAGVLHARRCVGTVGRVGTACVVVDVCYVFVCYVFGADVVCCVSVLGGSRVWTGCGFRVGCRVLGVGGVWTVLRPYAGTSACRRRFESRVMSAVEISLGAEQIDHITKMRDFEAAAPSPVQSPRPGDPHPMA